jgi:hypothetical protein
LCKILASPKFKIRVEPGPHEYFELPVEGSPTSKNTSIKVEAKQAKHGKKSKSIP